MRGRPSPIEALVTLSRLKDADERRARWRQVITALGGDSRVEGPPPLDELRGEQLLEAARVALNTGLVDDLDWISGGTAALALYELTSALPQGAQERREFGRRLFARLYGGNAETFAAVATRMALGSTRQFEAATLRARVSLLFSLPVDSSVNADPLAFNLIARREHFERWVVQPSTGPLPARRLAATLLERAAREAARRYQQGDTYAHQVMTSDLVRPTYQLLLADREPLVWRHAAVARGLLSGIDQQTRAEIDLMLDPNLSPTQWRRSVVSLVTCLVSDYDTTMQQCRSLLLGEIAQKHPAIAATMIWGLAPVIHVEPDAAEDLLTEICKSTRRDVAEALASLLEDVRNPAFASSVVNRIRNAISSQPVREPAMAAVVEEIRRGLDRDYRHDDTIFGAIRRAMVAFETTGAFQAHEIAEEALTRAHDAVSSLDALSGQGDAALPRILPLLHDLDVSALERSRLYDLLLLGRRPGDATAAVPGLEILYDRLGNWMLSDEKQNNDNDESVRGRVLARQRKLLVLLHLVDVETTKNIEGSELSKRVRGRLRRVIKLLLRRLTNNPNSQAHRILCATLARSLDAAVREQVAEPSDLLLLIVRYITDEQTLLAIVTASTNPEVRQVLSAYMAFLSGTDPELADEPEARAFNIDEAETAARLVKLSNGIGTNGSYRGEALRQVLLRMGRALQLVASARGLQEIFDEATGDGNVLADVELTVERLRQLLRGATRRVLKEEPDGGIDIVADVTPLSLLIERASSSGNQLDSTLIAMAISEVTAELPAPIAKVLVVVLSRLDSLPMAPGSDVSVIPLRSRRASLPDWLMPRRTIGGFYVVRALGSGGVSSVFLARRIEERREANAESYALKVPQYDPNTARSVSEQEFMDMFRMEAGALLSLPKHQNLARFVNFDLEARPKPMLVMELIRGQSLDRMIRSQALTMQHALHYLLGILAGIEAMHSVGVAHLDVKPSNVILREEGTPVLVDFGLSGRHLRPGCGTLEYCAPEILGVVPEGWESSPEPADLYAFAATAFEVLTGALLFDANDEMTIISQHVSHDGWPDKLADLAQLPEHRELCSMLASCLRRDPRLRPSATQLRLALTRSVQKIASMPWPMLARRRRASISA